VRRKFDICHGLEMKRPMHRALPWSESFAVGHHGLDTEHRRMVDAINDIIAAVHSRQDLERLPDLLRVLRDVTVEHFHHENTLLRDIKSGAYKPLQGLPRTQNFLKAMAEAAFDDHIADHETMLARFDTICSHAIETLCEALKAWLVDHVIKHDSHLKAIFQAM
jgi:hemerythrin